jgi:predicted ribosomally synthesized peptide with nif11-like leader
MSEEQLSVLLAKLKEDSSLREKLQGAGDLDTFIAMAKEAGFDVSKADLLKYQAKAKEVELSDEELEEVAGGTATFYELAKCVFVGTFDDGLGWGNSTNVNCR